MSSLFLVVTHVSAQKVNPMFYKEIQLQHKPYTLHTLTREIQRQSGITFSYDAVRIDPDKRVRLRKNQDRLTVRELLAVLRKKTGVGYKVVSSSHIIYTYSGGKKKKSRKPAKYRSPKPPAKEQLPVSLPEDNDAAEPYIAALREDSTFEHQIIVVGDSSLAVGHYLSGGGGGGGAYAGHNDPKYPVTMTEPAGWNDDEQEEEEEKRPYSGGFYTPLGQSATVTFIKKNTIMAAGITADEIYYLNPTVRAGFTFLYGTIAYNWGNFSHWRYGLGTSARVGNRWWGHFEWNTGNTLSQRYNIQTFDTFQPPPVDSIQQPPVITENNRPLLVQSKLNRFTLAMEWDMSGNVSLGAGLTMNFLKTTYYSNGNKVALSNVLPIGYDADQKYKTIDPPYTFSNSYTGNNVSNTKMWIGIQLRLIYKLNFFER